ncbi:hypothetical protein COCNU_scaffold000495G000030 [Cocos nucifera]|nr:hypothetical protein [Cocos nucifera]
MASSHGSAPLILSKYVAERYGDDPSSQLFLNLEGWLSTIGGDNERDKSLPLASRSAEAVLELRAGSMDLATRAMAMPVDSTMELAMEVTLPASPVKVAVEDSAIRAIEVTKMAELVVPMGSTKVKEAIPATSLLLVDT